MCLNLCPVKSKKLRETLVSKRRLSYREFHSALPRHICEQIRFSFLQFTVKARATVVSDRLDIAGVRRYRINTRDVHHPISLSLSLFASASSASEVYLRVSLPVPVPVELARTRA